MPVRRPPADFFCIGVPKAASTWLAGVLRHHPHVVVSRPKETNQYVRTWRVFPVEENPDFLRDATAYEACFAHGPATGMRGDFSVEMYRSEGSMEAVLADCPEARFIVMLRDPVKRLYSHYWNRKRRRPRRTVPKTFEEAIQDEGFLATSRYAGQLRPWFEAVGDDRILPVLQEDVAQDPWAAAQRVCRFLDLDSGPVRPHVGRRRNSAGQARWRQKTAPVWAVGRRLGLRRALQAASQTRMADSLRQRAARSRAYPPMAPDAEARLRAEFEDEVIACETLLGRNLDVWRQHD